MKQTKQVFRPAFTPENILYLCTTLATDKSTEGKKLYAYLLQFKFKINNGLVSAAYETSKQTLHESLGFGDTTKATTVEEKATLVTAQLNLLPVESLTPQEQYELLANKSILETITPEEREQGKKLELELYGMDMGTFAAT